MLRALAGPGTRMRVRLALLLGLLVVAGPRFDLGALAAALPAPPTRAAAQVGGYSPSFELVGEVERPRRFTLDDLQRLRATEYTNVWTDDPDGGASTTATFRGVLLWDLIREAGVKNLTGHPEDAARKYVVLVGADGFQAIVSLGEIHPALSGQQVLIAYARDGALLDQRRGMAQVVVPGDKTSMRAVYWLARVEVRDADTVPLRGK